MRILVFFRSRLDVGRGTPSRARNMALALAAKNGIDVLVVSRDSSFDRPGISHLSLQTTSLGDAVSEFRPDVIYGHTHKSLRPLAAIGACLKIADLHGDPVAEKLEETWRPLSRRLKNAARMWWLTRRYLGRLDGYTTVSSLLARRAEKRGLPARVIHGGVDPAVFTASKGDPGPLVVGYAGNFRPYQGLEVLIEAVSTLVKAGVEVRLILVGDPGDGDLAERAVRSLSDRVEMTGPLPYSDVPQALRGANVLVIPRPDSGTARAGFPSKLAEYMAMGKALVVTDVGDQAAVVQDGHSGIVVPPGDAGALARALDSLRHGPLRERLGANARATAEQQLNWYAIADDIVDFFADVQRRQ